MAQSTQEMKSSKEILSEGDSWIETILLPEELKCDDKTFRELLSLKPDDRGKIIIFGKEIDVPRWQKPFGQDYYFSGMNHKCEQISHPFLLKLLDFVCKHSGKEYKQILINWYLDGTEYIGAHSDDETQLVPKSSIYSFSFGATRDFIVTSKKENFRSVIPLQNNSGLVMGGQMQTYYKHQVPKRLRVKEPRINVTMRLYK